MSGGDEPEGHGGAPVRVLVVDDQRLVREGIASLLGIQPGITVVGTAVDGADAVDRALELRPDVVLMDVRMPGMDGVEAVAVLRDRAPECRIVMLTTFDDEEYVVRALRAGAAGYLLKDLPARDLAEAVRLARAGVAQLDASAVARLAAALPGPPGPGGGPRDGGSRGEPRDGSARDGGARDGSARGGRPRCCGSSRSARPTARSPESSSSARARSRTTSPGSSSGSDCGTGPTPRSTPATTA